MSFWCSFDLHSTYCGSTASKQASYIAVRKKAQWVSAFYRFHVLRRGASAHHRGCARGCWCRCWVCRGRRGRLPPPKLLFYLLHIISWKARGGLNWRPWRIVTGEKACIEAEPVDLAALGPITKADDAPVVTRSTLKSSYLPPSAFT